jgi:hypothetical protein
MRLPCDVAFDLGFFRPLGMFVAPQPISPGNGFSIGYSARAETQFFLRRRVGVYPFRAALEIGRVATRLAAGKITGSLAPDDPKDLTCGLF